MYCICCGEVIEPDECDGDELCTACAETFNE
jgi:predicted nucleic acid-binding Zn ribbon protein